MNKKLPRIIKTTGTLLLVVSFLGLFFTFGPALKQEAEYSIKTSSNSTVQKIVKKKDLTPQNTNFWIVVPKIEASAPVFENVDSQNPHSYLPALQKGVAHALGTSTPDKPGNSYIFAHSTDAFYNVGRYNAVFYLLGKLDTGDEINVYYRGEKYIYIVQEKKVVDPESVKYLGNLGGDTLTLQTCYPPGTTSKRLIVIANKVENDSI